MDRGVTIMKFHCATAFVAMVITIKNKLLSLEVIRATQVNCSEEAILVEKKQTGIKRLTSQDMETFGSPIG